MIRTFSKPRSIGLFAVGLVGMLVGATAAPAAAAEGSNWWYDNYDVAAAQADGWTGEGVHIAVIDAQINPDLPVFDGANLTVVPEGLCAGTSAASSDFNPSTSHGTDVTALLIGNGTGAGSVRGMAPDAAVTFYGFGAADPEATTACEPAAPAAAAEISPLAWGIRQAIDAGADIISVSMTVADSGTYDTDIIAEAIARGVIIVGGLPNSTESSTLLSPYPASYRGAVSVNAIDAAGALTTDESDPSRPNLHNDVTVVAPGEDFATVGTQAGGWDSTGSASGTSLATPLVAGVLTLTAQKYPDATGSQLLQSLILNTYLEDHPLEYDDVNGFGYGVASLTHLLRVDPTQYADENPLLAKSTDYLGPTDEQIASAMAAFGGDADPSASAPPTDGPAAPDTSVAPDADGMPGWLLAVVIGAVIVGIVVIGGVILTIVLINRSKKSSNGDAR